jgi:NAD(P)-dependent dehydrogenase (short-subunit alcohol dehydrogenase family)
MTFSEFVQDQRKPLPLAPTSSSCKGATYIVTGANTGLGFEAAKHLVALSSARVILGVRSLKKGEEAKAKIEAETGIKGVAEVWHLDLTSSDSVKEFAKRVEGLERVDAVIENAGVAMGEWTTAKEGLETTLMVNDVSTLLLAVLVLPKLQESGRRFGVEPHLVVVGSAVAFGAEGELEKIDAEGDILEGLNQPMGMGKR